MSDGDLARLREAFELALEEPEPAATRTGGNTSYLSTFEKTTGPVTTTTTTVTTSSTSNSDQPRVISTRSTGRGGVVMEELEDVLRTQSTEGFQVSDSAVVVQVESPRGRRGGGVIMEEEIIVLTQTEETITQSFYDQDKITRSTEVVKERFEVGNEFEASRGMDLGGVETSAELLLTPRGGVRETFHDDMILSPRSTMETKKDIKWNAAGVDLEEAIKVLPKIEPGSVTEEHRYSDHQAITEKVLPERTEVITEEIEQKEEVRAIPEIRQVTQTVEHIVKVPRVRQETREVVKEVPVERIVQKIVEKPKYESRIVQKPITRWVEETVPIVKIKYEEEVVEVPVPVHKIEEVAEVVERLVPTFVTKHVKKPVEQFRDIIKVVERKQERVIEVPKYTYEKRKVEIPVEVVEEVIKYVEVPQIVEKVNIRKVEQLQEEVIRRPVKKVITTEIIREVPVIKKVKKEVVVDRVVLVPKRVEIAREVLVEKEQIVEIPRYIANVKHIYHHSGHEMKYMQKEIQFHKKRIVQYVGEQKQVTIQQHVVHVPKFVEVDVIEWVDLVTEKPIEIIKEEIVEVEKIIYETVEEETVVEKKRQKFVEVEQVQTVTKYVEVPQELIVRVPKIIYLDNTQIMENIVEVPEIIWKDRVVEKIVDVWIDKYVEVPMVKTIDEYIEIPQVVKMDKIIEIPVIEVRETFVDVPEIKTVQIFVDDVTVIEEVKYVDVKVDMIEEEIVEVPQVRNIEKPELVMVDTNIYVPKIKKVGVIMEIDCEVHHDVFEETTSEIIVDIEKKEDIIQDRIHVNEGELEPIIEPTHVWDHSAIPMEYQGFVLPELTIDGCIVGEEALRVVSEVAE